MQTIQDHCNKMLASQVDRSQVDAALARVPTTKKQVEDELQTMRSLADKLEDDTRRLKDDNGKFDLAKYKRMAEEAKQKQLDNMLHLVLANEDETLDRLRNMSRSTRRPC